MKSGVMLFDNGYKIIMIHHDPVMHCKWQVDQ